MENNANNNWVKWGEDIRDTVQSSIDARDFSNLNQSVGRIIEGAVKNINDSLKNVNVNVNKNHTARESTAKAGPEAQPKTPPRAEQNTVPRHMAKAKPAIPKLYGETVSTTGIGIALAALGCLGAAGISIGILVELLAGLLGRGLGIGNIVGLSAMGILLAGSILIAVKGTKMVGLVSRFQRYVKELGNKMYCSVQELAKRTGKSENFVKKDLRIMMAKGFFRQGHMDEEGTCLMVSDDSYAQYRLARQQYLEREKQKQRKADASASLPENARQVIEEGENFLCQIHESNEAIAGQVISAKISRMEHIIQKIFQRVRQKPELVSDLKKLMEYYLPTTVKLLDAYEELDAQPIQGENIASSKKEIEDTMDTLNTAFENLLDGFFQDTAWDISSDISVLETMLAQEGLTPSDFQKKQ